MVTLKFYTIQDKTAQVLKFSNLKVHHFKFIRGHYAKLIVFFPFREDYYLEKSIKKQNGVSRNVSIH